MAVVILIVLTGVEAALAIADPSPFKIGCLVVVALSLVWTAMMKL